MAPIQTGIQSGMNSGIGSGLDWWPYSTGPSLLANLDFSAPTTSWKTGRTGFSSAYATDEWLLQETSGDYANNKGGTPLAVAGSLSLRNQSAVGIYDGSSLLARKAWELPSSVARADYLYTNADTSTLDSDNTDLCACIVFRQKGNASVPANSNACSAPRALSSSATARAGKTWPPVPPPAMSSLMRPSQADRHGPVGRCPAADRCRRRWPAATIRRS